MQLILSKNFLPHHSNNLWLNLASFLKRKKAIFSLPYPNIAWDWHRLFTLSLFVLATFILISPEASAVVPDGEMTPSTLRLNALLSGNIMNVIMGIGIAASVVFAFMKSSLIPLGIGISSGVLYGFAKTWIDAVFALCV
jgi:hypothetical protein